MSVRSVAQVRALIGERLKADVHDLDNISQGFEAKSDDGDRLAWFEFLLLVQITEQKVPDWVVDAAIEYVSYAIGKGAGGGSRGRGQSAKPLYERSQVVKARVEAVEAVLIAQRRLHEHRTDFHPDFYRLIAEGGRPEINGNPVRREQAGSTDEEAYSYASELLRRSPAFGEANVIRRDWKNHLKAQAVPSLYLTETALGWRW